MINNLTLFGFFVTVFASLALGAVSYFALRFIFGRLGKKLLFWVPSPLPVGVFAFVALNEHLNPLWFVAVLLIAEACGLLACYLCNRFLPAKS